MKNSHLIKRDETQAQRDALREDMLANSQKFNTKVREVYNREIDIDEVSEEAGKRLADEQKKLLQQEVERAIEFMQGEINSFNNLIEPNV